ncbi:hypothetical protein GHT06_016908 [Daphnia sinensis]|uniref:Uncharacterized protein n=1 Tax=Daphnia sinensis TaxID=1820382 RepID=A0AAD5L6K1_9CRUS|nr:hypothetical protein GHT06_016908 [Daphnia sinensis]
MWNLTNRPRAGDPHCWTNHTNIETYKEMGSPLIIMPDKLNQDSQISVLRARAVIPTVNISSAPKPPKKRFLEAAAAHQLEEQQKREREQQDKSKANAEDNSALMQLAEMCVYYQASNTSHPSGSWSPVTGGWDCVDHRVMAAEKPVEPTVYSISMNSTVQSEASPKAATPFWSGWANRSLLQPEQSLGGRQEEDENEEPLDLSGEETIRTNQQELIDHLVEKLCARPVFGKFSSLVQKKLSLLEPSPSLETSPVQNSSSEVSSSIDLKDSVTVAAKDVNRRDLPLKKRDPSSLQESYDQRGDYCDSSTATKLESSLKETVSSTNNSKKPAPRSCKGKRYLEFMYEGRITLSGRGLKRAESSEHQTDDQTCDQSSIGSKNNKRQRQVRQTEAGTGKTTVSLRGRNAKLRKLS